MDDRAGDDRLVLRTPPDGRFARRDVILAPGQERRFEEAEWRDTLVVVVAGSVEIETRCGVRRTFMRGDVAFLTGLSLRTIRNPGQMSAVLDTVRRRPAAAPNDESRHGRRSNPMTMQEGSSMGQRSQTMSIDELRDQVRGTVIGPDDPGYDAARTVFYGGIDRRPAAVVKVADDADVRRVVALARDAGGEVAVRSGGHSIAGQSVSDGGLVIDLSAMRRMDVDVDARTAWAETGLTAAEYTSLAATNGLATGFGDTGSVGIGGLTLGGGVGYLVRKHGLTIDDLLAADVVTADGEVVRADHESHPELFWALRGGGGNFGVATRFRFRLHELPSVVGGMLLLPASPENILAFMDAAAAAPNELSTIANVMPAPPMPFIPEEIHGTLAIMALMCFAGDADAGQRALAPFRAIATPLADMLRPTSYPELYPPAEEGFHPIAVSRNLMIDDVDRASAEVIVEGLQASDAPMRAVQLRALGGAVAEVPNDATAYAHRDRPIMANVAAMFGDPRDRDRHASWVDSLSGRIQRGPVASYVNFVGDEGPDRVRAAYPGATWERLAAVKRAYDPDNLFHLNQNIPPEAGDRR
jgi:FAD/FMN-containing dehydrogenase